MPMRLPVALSGTVVRNGTNESDPKSPAGLEVLVAGLELVEPVVPDPALSVSEPVPVPVPGGVLAVVPAGEPVDAGDAVFVAVFVAVPGGAGFGPVHPTTTEMANAASRVTVRIVRGRALDPVSATNAGMMSSWCGVVSQNGVT
jgi:hypothetical protein